MLTFRCFNVQLLISLLISTKFNNAKPDRTKKKIISI